MSDLTYTYHNRYGGQSKGVKLSACWEVNYDPMSDYYTPSEMSPKALFELWTEVVKEKHPSGLIPILWAVEGKGPRTAHFEFMPFQHQEIDFDIDFLTFFSWPICEQTGNRLDWLKLPVVDKFWRRSAEATKGGFIQEYTGWKPAILQPYVYLPSLIICKGEPYGYRTCG